METNAQARKFESPEAEIAYLKQEILNKELELKNKSVEYTKENLVRDKIKEYEENLREEVLADSFGLSQEEIDNLSLKLSPEMHDEKVKSLIKILNDKGLRNALDILKKMNNPHLDDDFHRFLVQYLYSGHSIKGVNLQASEFRGLSMTLYEVVLPEDFDDESKNKTLKEVISNMEQFLSGMLSVVSKENPSSDEKNYIVFEIANAIGSEKFVFYVAVPNEHKGLFEKHITSVFHNAVINQITDDYNIFNSEGYSAGSILEPEKNSIYEFKTYEKFDHDPMNAILNSFSKIDKDGEGAAIQVVFAPRSDYFIKRYEYAISQIEKGVPTKEATDLPETMAGEFGKTLKGFFKKTQSEDDKKEIDNDAIQKIKNKISSVVVATNIRIITSAKTKTDAERLLQNIESSFNQFTDTQGNGLKVKRLAKDDLMKMFRRFAFRTYSDLDLLPLNLREVSSLVHFHNSKLAPTPGLKQNQSISAPPPDDMLNTGIYLGKNNYRNSSKDVYIGEVDRLRHVYTIGQTGTGKTNLLLNMIIQDIKKGEGCCYIDPHGTDIQKILACVPKERFRDVIYFDPSYTERPMALNMLEYDPEHPEQKTFVVNELFSIFQKLYGGVPESMGPMFEQYFRNATMLVIEDPETGSTLLDVSRVMTNKAFRDLKISRCKNPVVVQFWREIAEKAGGEASLANIVPYITSKFDIFLANDIMRPIIAQEKSSFNFRDIMDKKKILLVNLSKGRLGDINANLIGLILVGKILMAALSRVDLVGKGDFPPFYLYIDEFQNITTNSISTILSEARKYKLSLNIVHQFIAQLEENIKNAVFGNVGSIFSFRVGSEDAEFLEKQFSPVFTSKDIMNIDNYNFYAKMLVNGKTTKAFNVRAEPPPKGNDTIVESLKQLSYLSYGGDREEIEKEILEKYKK